ncbi:MAG: class I SAM-dependent methyltransferase [Planctomycetota bacterium]
MTTKSRPPAPTTNEVRTYYERPLLDRVSGRYVVAWDTPDGPASIRVHNRVVDLEGERPSLRSVLGLPRVLASYLEARRRPLLRRPLPFLNFDAIRHLARLVPDGAPTRVAEVGAGNSTLWLLARGAHVTTIEHDARWARELAREAAARGLAGRLTLHVAEGAAALEALSGLDDATLDLLLVDCKNAHTRRHDCIARGRQKVRSGGTVCLDNSDHPNNWSAAELMRDRERTRFSGFGPMCAVVTQTSFWQV